MISQITSVFGVHTALCGGCGALTVGVWSPKLGECYCVRGVRRV